MVQQYFLTGLLMNGSSVCPSHHRRNNPNIWEKKCVSSVMLITNRLHCIMNSTKCFAHEEYEDKKGKVNTTNLLLLYSNDVEGTYPFGGSFWVWGERISFHQTDGGGTEIHQNSFSNICSISQERQLRYRLSIK